MKTFPVHFIAPRSWFATGVVLILGWMEVSLPRLQAAAEPAPLTADSLRILVSQNKVTPDQAKILQGDLDSIATLEQKIAEIRKLPPEQLKVKSTLLKYQGLQRELTVAQHELSADALKFTTVPTPTPTPTPRARR